MRRIPQPRLGVGLGGPRRQTAQRRARHLRRGLLDRPQRRAQHQRDRAIRDFKSGAMTVLVATDVAARGLDIPDVKHVYNYELPNQPESYVHRIGRTARAGNEGAAIAFCSMEEMDDLAAIQKVVGIEIPVASGNPWSRRDSKQPPEPSCVGVEKY